MSHSVRRHLGLEIQEYDTTIRRFIPGYDAMLAVAAKAALSAGPGRVLDLGSGTGALARELLVRDDRVRVELLDADPEMLDQARERLAGYRSRVDVRVGSFAEALPGADVVTASLSLHHLPSLEEKEAVFRHIGEALPTGGLFVNADVTLPGGEADRAGAFRDWAAHLVECGISEDRAWKHFRDWANEDTYFPVEDEMAALGRAGFDPDLRWQHRVVTVVVAHKR